MGRYHGIVNTTNPLEMCLKMLVFEVNKDRPGIYELNQLNPHFFKRIMKACIYFSILSCKNALFDYITIKMRFIHNTFEVSYTYYWF